MVVSIDLQERFGNVERVVYLIGKYGYGRRRLAQKLHSTEMRTRILLNYLAKEGLIGFSKRGCFLTKKGERIFKKIDSLLGRVERISLKKLSLDKVCVGALLKQTRLENSWMVRDEAIRGGATGAIVLSSVKGKLIMPPSKTQVREYQEDYYTIKDTLRPSSGDTVVITCASNIEKALESFWGVVSWILSRNSRKF